MPDLSQALAASLPFERAVQPILVGGALNLVAAIVILILGWMLSNFAARWTREGLRHLHYMDATIKPLLASLVKYLILGLTLMSVLSRFGVQTTSIIALLGAVGLAVGLALQGTLSNVASGVMLLMLRPFRVREKITIVGAATGTVREIGLFRTTIIGSDGEYISLPNTIIFSGVLINVTREPTRRVSFAVTLDPAADIKAAQKLGLEILHGDPRVLKTPAPDVPVDRLDPHAVQISIQGWVMTANYDAAKSDLQRAVRARFTEAGLEPPRRIVTWDRDTPAAPGH